MSHVAREYFTVDLRGLRAALSARAAASDMTESDVLRSALAATLGVDRGAPVATSSAVMRPAPTPRVKLSVRLSHFAAQRLDASARAAGLSRGAYLLRLIDGAPPVTPIADDAALVAALASSTAEMAVLSRDLNDLMRLLRQGSVQAAREYRDRLFTLDKNVQRHMEVAASTLVALRARHLIGPDTAAKRVNRGRGAT
jgi:hypothetical protein